MAIAVYAGSFDPITNGHMAVLRGALQLAEKVVMAIGTHESKKPLFTFTERKKLIEQALQNLPGQEAGRVEVLAFDALLVTKAQEINAQILIRGLRNSTDFDYEMQMAGMNRKLVPNLQTIFVPAEDENRFISGSLVRQIASMGGDVTPFVPLNVAPALTKKFALA
ncbi:MAG: pantetheine-phosphate adenylyltransferase [Candidatus Tokpelaia sp.]|uniref:pantetheine-phosphate adenylyltransferase n=1 Tax=Candidatus Tokpelaia sp. TaxID=2233777 RepID=UPI001239EA92|nr:pantetheine-phosphate adenylyltransferase [Candidatus Tokpelaia sp.]KAA6206669.1 MAG: pantetheine-phosphate adenylyltransferase [Candidatus Tokpelaia sp.]KAA6206964.1 MAG: pantetheine-phosphate adenylyltransferase [Candidatus Tokpelaia sp.]KAA6405551.1 pantetheine-phosphate adenylyltransferase [Candidatus Tokpelaia sp.]